MTSNCITQSSEFSCKEIIKELEGLWFSREQRRTLIKNIWTLKLTRYMVGSILSQSIDEIENNSNYNDEDRKYIKDILLYLKWWQIGNYIRNNTNINEDLRLLVDKYISKRDFFEPVELYKSIQDFIKEAFWINTKCYTRKRNWNLANIFDRDEEIDINWANNHFHNEKILNSTTRSFCSELSNIWWLFAVKLNIPWKGDAIVSFWDENDDYDTISRIWELLIDHKLLDLVQEKLKYLSARFIDKLTWAYNKDYIELIWKKWDYSIIMIDINDFKKINDYCWYAKWDEILKDLTKIVNESIRTEDRLCRQWWDEFVVFVKYDNIKSQDENLINLEQLEKRIKSKISMIQYSYCAEEWEVEESLTISSWFAIFEKWKKYQDLSKTAEWIMKKEKTSDSAKHRIWKNIGLLTEKEQIEFYVNNINKLSESSRLKILESLKTWIDNAPKLEMNHLWTNKSALRWEIN